MKQTLLLLILLITESCLAGEYSDCILENMKGVNDRLAVIQVKSACREKALPYVPAKCYRTEEQANMLPNIPNMPIPSFGEFIKDSECIDNCLNASFLSKHFGDCKE